MKLKVLLLYVSSILNLLFWIDGHHSINNISMAFPLISIVLSILFIPPKYSKGKIEIKIFYILIVGILFYNSPLYFKAIFNSKDVINILINTGIKEVYFVKSNLLLGISLPLITAGYLIVTSKVRNTYIQSNDNVLRLKNEQLGVYTLFALIFLILSLGDTGLTIGSTYSGVNSNFYLPLQRMIILIGSIFIFNRLVTNKVSNKLNKLTYTEVMSLIVVFLFAIYVLIGGDRGPALNIILILIFGYLLMQGMAIKKSHLILGAVAIAFMYSLFMFIEVLRLIDDNTINKEIIESALATYQEYNPEAGLTIRTTSAAIEGIENNLYQHTYGLFFLQSVIKGIPYLGDKIINLIFNENEIFNGGSATLLTTQISGHDFTSGLGTSYLADTFIEFGIVGIIVISFLYGMMAGEFENRIKYLSFIGFTDFLFVVLFVSSSFYLGRGTLGGFIVNFIHTWIYYIFIKALIINTLKSNVRNKIY